METYGKLTLERSRSSLFERGQRLAGTRSHVSPFCETSEGRVWAGLLCQGQLCSVPGDVSYKKWHAACHRVDRAVMQSSLVISRKSHISVTGQPFSRPGASAYQSADRPAVICDTSTRTVLVLPSRAGVASIHCTYPPWDCCGRSSTQVLSSRPFKPSPFPRNGNPERNESQGKCFLPDKSPSYVSAT